MGSNYYPIGEFIKFSAGGGWGKEEQHENLVQVAIIRGTDFPNIERGDYSTIPIRWENMSKVKKITLCPGDIIIENSGGSDTRPTGRTLYINHHLIEAFDIPIIPASFCRILRFSEAINSEYAYWWLQDMYNQGRTWSYQNRSTGIANFQFKIFSTEELIELKPIEEQEAIASILSTFNEKILVNNRLNDYLAA